MQEDIAQVKRCGTRSGGKNQNSYALVIWEDKACPILGGREEDGMPKLFADIPCERHVGDHWFTGASYESHTFLKLDFWRQNQLDEKDTAAINENPKINFFGWRYLPNLGRGGATLSHLTFYPQENHVKQVWTGEGKIEWTCLSREQHPLQWNIIHALAKLPVVKYTSATMSKSWARLNVGDSRILP